MPLCIIMMIPIAAITAIAMMTMTLAIIAGSGDNIALRRCILNVLFIAICLIKIDFKYIYNRNENYNKSKLARQYEACTPILRQHFPSEWKLKVAAKYIERHYDLQ